MKIVHIVWGMETGGIETMLVNIANEQSSFGNEVNVIIINNLINDELIEQFNKGIKLHKINRPIKSRNPYYIYLLNRKIGKINPDVIHIHETSISKYVFGRKSKKKLCVTVHDLLTPPNSKSIYKSGKIFAISNIVKDDINKKFGIDSTVVYNGIKVSNIVPKDDYAILDLFNIVQVGRLNHEIKGQDLLIKAAKLLLESDIKDFHVTFIGEGPSYNYLTNLVAELNLADYISFIGSKSQQFIFKNISNYHLLVQPSRNDGFGLTVAEAMAAKVPTLVSNNQGAMEVVDGGRLGYLFESNNEKDLAEKIKSIKFNYPDMNIINEGYKHTKEEFSVESTAEKYLNYYKELNRI